MTILSIIKRIKKVESIQYNAALAIMRAISETSKENFFEEPDLKSQQHRW